MSIRDQIANAELPDEWKARQVILGDVAEITTGLIRPVTEDDELLKQFGYDPADWEISGTINQWRKEQSDGTFLASYFFKAQRRMSSVDLPTLYARASKHKNRPVRVTTNGRVTVVALSDVQAGKTGSRGGTPELVERLFEKREALKEHLKLRKPESTVLLEAGDIFENFESGGNPMFTNDLSLTQQMDLAGAEITEFLKVMMPHGPVEVAAVPSNHTQWRRGKLNLGIPGDDLGLFVHKQVQRVAEASGWDVTWTVPAPHDESVVIDVLGTRIGMVHGNQYRPGKAIEWWAKQQHGGQPVGMADILVTGHYHHLLVHPTGRNPYTGRSKWWLQCPTLDNGSDWFRNMAGDDSDPGLLVFDVTENGFDLQSLAVL